MTVKGATTLAGRLVRGSGVPFMGVEGLTHLFPQPAALVEADLKAIGSPSARAKPFAGWREL